LISRKQNIPQDFDISKISSDDMIAKAIENIKVEYEQERLKLSTILEIYRAITIISLPEFTRNVKWERKGSFVIVTHDRKERKLRESEEIHRDLGRERKQF
jgi:hypothetical protein